MRQERFREELKRLDRKLDCAWNTEKSCYEVTHFGDSGKYVLYKIPMGQLHVFARQILTGIMKARNIPPEERLRQIEEEEDRQEQLIEKQISDDMSMVTSEGYDTFKRLEGQRITLSDVPFHVEDRRRVAP